MIPSFPKLGITRLARQTGLDRLGIPCFAAIRPNARTLAANQGKGIDDDAAMASAVMEAAEYAIAERPTAPTRLATIEELRRDGATLSIPTHKLPHEIGWPEQQPLTWLRGFDYFGRSERWAPLELVAIAPGDDGLPVAQSTNGLASGNVEEEAGFHALCELIERDAMTLWSFRSDRFMTGAALAAERFDDPLVDELARTIAGHGFRLRLFDLTTDLGVPVVMALIEEPGAALHFHLASGVGCHPVAARAALRAITEAAQTRITNVAGARDDFDPAEYRQRLHPALAALARIEPNPARLAPVGAAPGTTLAGLHASLAASLSQRGIDDVTMVPLGGSEVGIAVVKAIAPALEDMPGNPNWRPGPRAAAAMTRLW